MTKADKIEPVTKDLLTSAFLTFKKLNSKLRRVECRQSGSTATALLEDQRTLNISSEGKGSTLGKRELVQNVRMLDDG